MRKGKSRYTKGFDAAERGDGGFRASGSVGVMGAENVAVRGDKCAGGGAGGVNDEGRTGI